MARIIVTSARSPSPTSSGNPQFTLSIKKLRKNIPEDMQSLNQWIFWKAEERSGKSTKVPCNESGYAVDCTLAEHHCTFGTVLNGMRRANGKVDGIGFVFMENGISGIDVDHCIDESGNISDSARAIIDEFGSYTEISPSGRGIHIIVKGCLPEQIRGDNKYLGGKNGDYEAYSSGRYFTMTGSVFEKRKKLRRKPKKLEWFWNTYIKPTSCTHAENASDDQRAASGQSADQIISRINSSTDKPKFELLMRGDTSEYKSPSEADLGLLVLLARHCWGDRDLIEEIFHRSELSKRKKWQRVDYRNRTISKAISIATQGNIADKTLMKPLQVYSAADLERKIFPDIQWVIPDMLPEGFALLAGKPKKGKSWLALNIALACATGGSIFGMDIQQRDVLYVALEDGERRLKQRLRALCNDRPFPDTLYFADSSQFPHLHGGDCKSLFAYLDENSRVKLVIIDTIGKIMPRQSRHGTQYHHEYDYTSGLQKECIERNICILVIAHTRKAEAADPFDSVSGTLGMTGAADTVWVLKSSPTDRASAQLHVAGREVATEAFDMSFQDGTWSLIGRSDDLAVSEPRRKIIEFLQENGPHTPREIAEALDIQGGNARKMIFAMKKAGQLQATQEGKYDIPTNVTE